MYLEILNDIETFFESHSQVGEYIFGNISELSTTNKTFPLVFLQPATSTLTENEIQYNFNLFSFTLYEENDPNLENNLNDTYAIIEDFVSWYVNNVSTDFWLDVNVTIEPLTAEFDDYLVGWSADITFIIPNSYGCTTLTNLEIPIPVTSPSVVFWGPTKKIYINEDVTDLNVQVDLYSDWKEWIILDDNSKWEAAFRTFGGDETSEGQYAPQYFFLINDWKVVAINVAVVIQTNLYSDDGLSPVEIYNSSVLIRNSDVPVVKTELEQRLDYGDRVYYDESSIYEGTEYPNGTIAQPINNPVDAITIANQYNINDIYCLSDVTMPGISGISFDDWEMYADRPNLTFSVPGNNIYNNMLFSGFVIDVDLSGTSNIIENSIIENLYNYDGIIKNSQIRGTVEVFPYGNIVLSHCFSGIAGTQTPTFDMKAGIPTTLSIRSYSGGVKLTNCDTPEDVSTIELVAGQIILDTSCTDGTVDVRGVGYLTDNSNGSNIINTGFIDSFEEYKDQQEINAYGNRIFIDTVNGFTGTTFPAGTAGQPTNNVLDTFIVSNNTNIKNIHFRESITLDGLFFQIDDFNAISDIPNVPFYMPSPNGSFAYNVNLNGFDVIDADFYGHEHNFENCILRQVDNIAGHLVACDLDGGRNPNDPYYGSGGTSINVSGNATFVRCHPKHTLDAPTINLVGLSGSSCSFRDYRGDIIFDSMIHADDNIILDSGGAGVTINSGCTAGTITLRGIGSLIDNSSGTTVIRTAYLP